MSEDLDTACYRVLDTLQLIRFGCNLGASISLLGLHRTRQFTTTQIGVAPCLCNLMGTMMHATASPTALLSEASSDELVAVVPIAQVRPLPSQTALHALSSGSGARHAEACLCCGLFQCLGITCRCLLEGSCKVLLLASVLPPRGLLSLVQACTVGSYGLGRKEELHRIHTNTILGGKPVEGTQVEDPHNHGTCETPLGKPRTAPRCLFDPLCKAQNPAGPFRRVVYSIDATPLRASVIHERLHTCLVPPWHRRLSWNSVPREKQVRSSTLSRAFKQYRKRHAF